MPLYKFCGTVVVYNNNYNLNKISDYHLTIMVTFKEESSLEDGLQKPIFIFGCCNSGTSILWQALRAHPDVSGPEIEGQDLEELPDSMKHHLGKATFRLWAHPKFKLAYYKTEQDYDEEDRMRILAAYQKHTLPGKRLITKSPADTLRARLIQAYFPDAYFIAIVRNGYAVSEGIVRKRKHDPERPQFRGMFTTIDEAAEQWFRANIVITSHQKFLERYKIITYEDLVEHPQEALCSVLGFCGLDCKGFPMPQFSAGHNQDQISRLSYYDIETITRIAQPMLIHYGYEVLSKELRW